VRPKEGKDDEAERKEIEQLLNDPNNADETFLDIVHKCVIDWGVIGWWAIEVSRGTDGLVNGLFHVPAQILSGSRYPQALVHPLRGEPDRE